MGLPALLGNVTRSTVVVVGALQSCGLGVDGIPGAGRVAPSGFSPGLGKGLKGSLTERGMRGLFSPSIRGGSSSSPQALCPPPGSGSQAVINCSGRVRQGPCGSGSLLLSLLELC